MNDGPFACIPLDKACPGSCALWAGSFINTVILLRKYIFYPMLFWRFSTYSNRMDASYRASGKLVFVMDEVLYIPLLSQGMEKDNIRKSRGGWFRNINIGHLCHR
jgi:hypothetical protein